MLDLVGLSKRYGPIRALDDVSVTVDVGEVVPLVGENGAGESTLVKCVARNTMSETGMITLGGTAAIDAVHEGGLGDVVALKGGLISRVPLADVAGRIKPVDEQLWDTPNSLFELPLEQFWGASSAFDVVAISPKP